MNPFLKKILQKPKVALVGEVNEVWIDRFTAVHFLIGCSYGLFQIRFVLVLALAIGWEIIENPLKFHFSKIFPNGTADSFKNIVSDIFAVILGWFLIRLFMNSVA